jgi:hypothetical protein
VPKPEEFELIMWYDLSPMRPDDYLRVNAYRWHEAVALRNAYNEGVQDAAREKQTHDKLLAMEPQA